MAQLVENLPAMQETWVRSLGWEDPLEKGKATHSSILAWRILWTVYSMGSQESDTTEQLSLTLVAAKKWQIAQPSFQTLGREEACPFSDRSM